jgi:hypothetical protein
MIRGAMLALALTACFRQSYDHPSCSLAGECPEGLVCVADACLRPGESPGDDAALPTPRSPMARRRRPGRYARARCTACASIRRRPSA